MSAFCEACGQPRIPGARFCRGCGLPYEGADDTTVSSDAGEAPTAVLGGYDTAPGAPPRSDFWSEPVPDWRTTADVERERHPQPAPEPRTPEPDAAGHTLVFDGPVAPESQHPGHSNPVPSGPPPAPTDTGAARRRNTIIASAAGVILLLAAIGGGAYALLAGGEDDDQAPIAKRTAPTKARGTTEAAAAAAAARAGGTGREEADDERSPDEPDPMDQVDEPTPADAADTDAETNFAEQSAQGYTAEVPNEWTYVLDDVAQPTPAGVTRRRTELKSDDGRRLIIDHLTGFDTPAADNRTTLSAAGPKSYPGYKLIAIDDVDLPTTTGYAWQFSHDEDGGRVRKSNLMFDLGGDSFAVLAVGRGDVMSYDALAALSERVAASISTG